MKTWHKVAIGAGAVVVLDGRVIGRGHNRVIAASDPTAHAEIRLPRGDVLAEAELLLFNAPESAFRPDEADRLGWKVYAD